MFQCVNIQLKTGLVFSPSYASLNLNYTMCANLHEKGLAFEWFEKKLEIVTINSTIPALIDLMSKQTALLNLTNEIFENIGMGINAVKIADTPFDQWVTDNKNAKGLKQIMENDTLKPNTAIKATARQLEIFTNLLWLFLLFGRLIHILYLFFHFKKLSHI